MNERTFYTALGMSIGATFSFIGGKSLPNTIVETLIFGGICYFILWPVFLQ